MWALLPVQRALPGHDPAPLPPPDRAAPAPRTRSSIPSSSPLSSYTRPSSAALSRLRQCGPAGQLVPMVGITAQRAVQKDALEEQVARIFGGQANAAMQLDRLLGDAAAGGGSERFDRACRLRVDSSSRPAPQQGLCARQPRPHVRHAMLQRLKQCDRAVELLAGLEGINRHRQHRIPRAELVSVITRHLGRLMEEVNKALKGLGFTGNRGQLVVFTGGGAELVGLADFAQQALGKPVRIGKAPHIPGLAETHAKPGFSTLSGLVLYAAADPVDIRAVGPSYQPTIRYAGMGLVVRIWRALREYF